MRRSTGLWAGALVILAYFGISNSPKGPASPRSEGSAAQDNQKNQEKRPEKEKAKAGALSPCEEIRDRLVRFSNIPAGTDADKLKLPGFCYDPKPEPEPKPKPDTYLHAFPNTRFVLALVPNPVATHLSLQFDRIVTSIQQAAQDDGYSYDASWFPWQETRKEYTYRNDQQAADELSTFQETQPGVMVFRGAIPRNERHFENGLVVFLVGEQPTRGINDTQFTSALAWMKQLRLSSPDQSMRILGPSFSGSLPSLQRLLEREKSSIESPIQVFSGSVSSGVGYGWFSAWIGRDPKNSFWSVFENDSLATGRFCQYMHDQGFPADRIAFLSEDETAYGGPDTSPDPAQKPEGPSERKAQPSATNHPCALAIRLYYPRDISTLRSAYQQQSILAPPQSQPNAPTSTLRGDISEPANSDHDTVRTYAGQLTPLAQEAILLDIASRLRQKQVQFVILRSTNSLDQIFLSEFLRRAYPPGRVVVDGADLLFSRGADARALRGVMMISTYPLLPAEQDWTGFSLASGAQPYRTFDQDLAEGIYVAGRHLFRDHSGPILDYDPPAWADPLPGDAGRLSHTATWVTVIGRRQFWPVAVLLDDVSDSNPQRITKPSTNSARPSPPSGCAAKVLHIPATMWLFLIGCVAWSAVHAYFCAKGCIPGITSGIMDSLRQRAYFAPIVHWQQPTLIALGSLLLAMLAVVVATTTGLFWWWQKTSCDPFDRPDVKVLWALLVAACLLLACLACWKNFSLQAVVPAPSGSPNGTFDNWRLYAARGALCLFLAFLITHLYMISRTGTFNAIPAYLRSVDLTNGVSPLVPQVLFIAGAYAWTWCALRGLAHSGEDRPRLPESKDLTFNGIVLSMFSEDQTGDAIECSARPLGDHYWWRLSLSAATALIISGVALQDLAVRSLGERPFGRLVFFWMCLNLAVVLADSVELWRAWTNLRRLLVYLDRLPLRRTLRGLKGLSWGSLWKISGNVLEQRYRLVSLQLESRNHLENTLREWDKCMPEEDSRKDALISQLTKCQQECQKLTQWFLEPAKPESPAGRSKAAAVDLTTLRDFQQQLARTAASAFTNILLPAWHTEKHSLIFDKTALDGKKPDDGEPAISIDDVPAHVLAAEEFFVLPYLGFIQNTLGSIRTTALGSLWIFIATSLAISSYPFDPINVLGALFLAVFLFYAGLMIIVYAQMSRDATLSHLTNTKPGELDAEFWQRILAYGLGPLLGLLTTLFPSLTDFIFSWLQPGAQAMK